VQDGSGVTVTVMVPVATPSQPFVPGSTVITAWKGTQEALSA